jgi:hypothetical protein
MSKFYTRVQALSVAFEWLIGLLLLGGLISAMFLAINSAKAEETGDGAVPVSRQTAQSDEEDVDDDEVAEKKEAPKLEPTLADAPTVAKSSEPVAPKSDDKKVTYLSLSKEAKGNSKTPVSKIKKKAFTKQEVSETKSVYIVGEHTPVGPNLEYGQLSGIHVVEPLINDLCRSLDNHRSYNGLVLELRFEANQKLIDAGQPYLTVYRVHADSISKPLLSLSKKQFQFAMDSIRPNSEFDTSVNLGDRKVYFYFAPFLSYPHGDNPRLDKQLLYDILGKAQVRAIDLEKSQSDTCSIYGVPLIGHFGRTLLEYMRASVDTDAVAAKTVEAASAKVSSVVPKEGKLTK